MEWSVRWNVGWWSGWHRWRSRVDFEEKRLPEPPWEWGQPVMGHGSLSIIVDVRSRGVCSRLSVDGGKEPSGDNFKDVLVEFCWR
jgi:hypothetical protein